MNPRPINTCIAMAAALALASFCALPAQATVVVDNFSSGATSSMFAAAPGDANYYREQLGSMAGGARQWYLLERGRTDLGGLVDVSPTGFQYRSNLGVGHRFDWFYGDTYVGHDHRVDLNFSAEDTLRFSFGDAPRGLNFNVLLYYRGQIDNYSQLGVNIGPESGAFNVDFRLSSFAAVIADITRPADFSHVSGIYIVTQSGGYFAGGGEGFRIVSISAVSAVPEPGAAAMILAGLSVLAGRQRRRPPGGAQRL